MVDTGIALGSDIIRAALEGCALFKLLGRIDGRSPLGRGLGRRFEGDGATGAVRLPAAANDPQQARAARARACR